MARYRVAIPLNPFSLSKHFRHSTRLPSACRFGKLKIGSLQLRFTSTARLRCEDDAEDHPVEYNWIDGVENLGRYKPKGYHPVMIGDMLHDRYRIMDKLGFGGYSTVWLAHDRYVHGDIHLHNVLVKLPSSFNHLSVQQFYKKYGEPETIPITLQDGKPLPLNIPPKAVIPLYLGMNTDKFKLHDAHVLLSNFGESHPPSSEICQGEDCHTPLAARPPEARFELQAALSYSADIWSLAVAIWQVLGMKAIFSNEYITEDEMVSQHINMLGAIPMSWWDCWEECGEFFDQDGRPTEGREVWPDLGQAFERGVQDYR